MLPATTRVVKRLQRPSMSYHHDITHLFLGRSMASSTGPSRLLWMRQEAEMQMLEEERRKEEEEQRREEAKKAELEREQSSVPPSAALMPNPSVTSEGVPKEDVNDEGQAGRQVGGEDDGNKDEQRFHDNEDET